jgi:hypothetical protein
MCPRADHVGASTTLPAIAPAASPPEMILASIEATLGRDPGRVVSHNNLNSGNAMWRMPEVPRTDEFTAPG